MTMYVIMGYFRPQNLKFLLWIVADPRSLTLLVGQHPFKLYIACNFVLSVAFFSTLLWADAYVNIFAAVGKPHSIFYVCCCESVSIQNLNVL